MEVENQGLSQRDKNELKGRIMKSILKNRNRRRDFRILLSSAAIVAIIVALGISFNNKSNSSIEAFVRSTPNTDPSKANSVTLILGEGTELSLSEENSKIKYSSTGEKVQIGSNRMVNQKSMKNKEIVFNTIIVPYGKRTDIQLSDGTFVWLNSGSKLVYPAFFGQDSRSVYLEGEAIFDVAHNAKKPFKVISENQEIEVLGTVFNVSHYPNDEMMYTVLKSGSVQMSNKKDPKNKIHLTPGTMAYYNPKNSNIKTKQVDVEDYFSWKLGILNIKSQDLNYIMNKLSRYYNIKITIVNEALAREKFSGSLDLNDDLKSVIENIKLTRNFRFEQNGNEITITN